MNSLLIATFADESSARHAMKKLDELAFNCQIDLYERTLIRKTARGRCEVFKGDVSAGWQTFAGAAAGSLLGLAAGPVGSVIGLISGAVVGSAISDREQYDFGEEIVKKFEKDVPREKVTIFAHLGERDTEMVDSILKRFDAHSFRRIFKDIEGDGNKENQLTKSRNIKGEKQ